MPEYLKASAGLIGKSYEGPQETRPDTEIDTVRNALRQSRELSDYCRSITNRLCGHVPETADGSAGKDYDPDGVLPQIGAEAYRSLRDMNDAMAALQRLASRFP
jgi:hypothetical protein